MHFKNFKQLWHLFLLVIIMAVFMIFMGCSSDDPLDLSGGEWQMPQKETYEYEVGPEGGTIEVKDHSSIHGFTIVIPEGALAAITKIWVTKYAEAPALPDGLETTYYPAIELTSDAPFLKEVTIKFPSFDTPENTGKMLCAFYWDTTRGSWQVVMPESFENDLMTVKTQHFSYWQWGEVILEDVEAETLDSFLDEAFGPDFMDRLADAFDVEAAKLIDWNNLDYCANQTEIANTLIEIKADAKIRAEEYLQLVNAVCSVWNHSPMVTDIFFGFNELIQIHLNYLGQTIAAEGLDLIPFVGGILSIMAKANAQAVYEQRLGELRDEYACIFREAEAGLWINVGLYFMADTALLGMELVETEYPCN